MAAEPPNRRRAVLILNPDAHRRIQAEPDGRMLAKTPGLMITSSEQGLEGDGLRSNDGWFEEGHMYLQSPFRRDLYVEAVEAPAVFATERQHVFLRFCKALGTRSLEVLQVTRLTNSSSETLGGSVTKGVEVSAKSASSQEEQFVRTLRTLETFDGGDADLVRATQILEESNLGSDLEFTTLLDLRSGSNPLMEREYDLTVTRSGQQQLSLAASLKVPAYAKLSVDYSSKLKVREEYQVRLRLAFGRR